jgi:MYXO-CTERM domain-containing protein
MQMTHRNAGRLVLAGAGQLAGLGDLPTTIDQLATDASQIIQASTRPNVPAYTGNLVTVPPATGPSGALLLGLGLAALALLFVMSRR